ncbi:hypothetical protein TNIN_308471 [Trichonephila inaurata madagascariensis]|uniref:Uncharacterized protein n=1 Tax=Trichonephila inaurata madagascariensis TaxID=2747483 RepID=A0A8X6I7E2_9ARAC|nr:hypothetical protein TNIN_308471 [Trichonephila inaurata madagascariensis]
MGEPPVVKKSHRRVAEVRNISRFRSYRERKRKTVVSATSSGFKLENPFDRFSSFEKIVSVIAWIYRFFKNCKLKKEDRVKRQLRVLERNYGEFTISKIIQRERFFWSRG